jgi:replication initiation protein RepC
MQTESALGASRPSPAKAPSGLRKLSLAMLATERLGEAFGGLPDKTLPGRVLAAFKAAAPALGYSARVVHAVDWLFSFTQAQDWSDGGRPVVWPSAALQQEALGIGETQAKAINRHLAELGLVVMKDSPNGKRYGKRDPQGRIVEAYGFDLSPLAARLAEFQAIAVKAREEREQTRHLRRRATIALRGLEQVLETAAELGFAGPEWGRLGREARELATVIRRAQRVEEIALGVAGLERRHAKAKKCLEEMSLEQAEAASEAVDSDPKGAENRPHQYNYKPNLHHQDEDVLAPEGRRSGVEDGARSGSSVRGEAPPKSSNGSGRTDSRPMMRVTPDELARLAPKLRAYLRTPSPSWPEIVDAADWLRHDLGVSKPLWGDACLAMGREQAAIALAIVSTKPAGHFTSGPGGYFHGMVARAKTGNLNLARTIWGMRNSQCGQVGMRT